MTDVLILEDELTSLQALSEILTTYSDDIRVHKASSLKEAKDLLDQEIRYGLFLLDVNLSGEDREDIGGILFAREIRERFEYTFTPIVMVTAIGNMEMQAYRELHCYQYIMKPFRREQVEEVVQKVLEKESREKPPVIVVKKGRDQLSAEMRGYPLSGSDTERNKTASCDGELGCPLCDSQTDAA